MSMELYNTLGRCMESFQPIHEGAVGIYCCGPTVYNYAHIGNLRAYVFDDILVRTLRYLGYKVTHVMNLTDVGHLTGDTDSGEDKMVKTAQERNKSVLEVAQFYTDAFFADTGRMNIERPTVVCKATEHVGDMIALIRRIEANGFTYSAGGNLYFDVSKFPKYGELALLNMDDMKAGARIVVDENKRNPADFALWFTKSKFENQALIWDSPWGRGYPGWHIECSAMSMKYLGEHFDIHTGGIDHIPIHHTNEIAQSEAATGKKWVNVWLHNEFLLMGREKMSKSAGGFLTMQSLIDAGYDPLDYRFFLLGAHYRTQLAFSWEALGAARSAFNNLRDRILALRKEVDPSPFGSMGKGAADWLQKFSEAARRDLNTPQCLAALWGLLKDPGIPASDQLAAAFDMDRVLGLGLSLLDAEKAADLEPELAALIEERISAKKAKNFSRADEIRGILKDKGILLEDGPNGTKWKRA
jgi:cysteinyl-tRNA synthetase